MKIHLQTFLCNVAKYGIEKYFKLYSPFLFFLAVTVVHLFAKCSAKKHVPSKIVQRTQNKRVCVCAR